MKSYKYLFKPLLYPILSAYEAKTLIEMMRRGKYGEHLIRVNIGYVKSHVKIYQDGIKLMGKEVNIEDLVAMLKDKRAAYIIMENLILKVEVRGVEKYYKLIVPYEGKAPTVEISGIHMHRIVGVDPWTDSLIKVKLARVRPGDKVLDICTGLGYTAIIARIFGAAYVMSIEKDKNVLKIAEANPWSRKLADPQIEIILQDAVKYLPELESRSFNVVIHDPPRFSKLTGELYSLDFYKEIYRVLKPGGRLFHYTGAPGVKFRRLNIAGSVANRLRRVGFVVKYAKEAGGILAFK